MEGESFAARAGRWSARHRRKAILGWLGFVLIALALGSAVGTQHIADEDLGDGESRTADQQLADAFPDRHSEQVLVQGRDDGVTTSDPRFRAAVGQVSAKLGRLRDVRDIKGPFEPGNEGQLSRDGRSALVTFEVLGDDEEAKDNVVPALDAVADVQRAHPELRVEEFGDASADKAVSKAFEDDFRKAETLSLPITLAILVIAFGALVAAGIPLLLAISAVAATLGLVGVVSQVVPFDENISSVILLIGLAVGVDYSLFYLRREREERARGATEEASLQAAAATSGRAVMISGLTVMVAMAGMYITGNATFMSFATGTILVVAIAVLGSLTVLPAVLAKLGDRVDRGRVPFRKRPTAEDQGEAGMWSAIVGRVMRRPVISLVAAGGLLVALSIPAFGLHTVNSGVNGIPEDLAIKQTYDRIQAAFPGNPIPATVVVKADDVTSPVVSDGIARMRRAAVETGEMKEPVTITIAPDRSVADVSIPVVGNGTDDASISALHTLRDDVVPATIDRTPGVESANVTGLTAQSVDFNDLLESRAPFVFLFVLGLAFCLLLVTFRSIVIPAKAIVLNLLSVGAAYGLLVLIFQDGRLENLLGYESIGGITAWLPLFLFVILFGLSMDYHVFILSRVREGFDRGMSTDEAVRHGIKRTAGVVTSAAIVMVFVFGIFATLSSLDFKQMGVGLAAAVLIDATIVRAVLLPASMKLLGDWNWYLPRWLEWLPRVTPEPTPTVAAVEEHEAKLEAVHSDGEPIRPVGAAPLDVEVERRGPRARLVLSGELDMTSVRKFESELLDVEVDGPDLVVIDLRGLTFMDSTGLHHIVAAVRRGRARGRRVALVKNGGPIDRILEITRIEEIVETVEDPAAVGFRDDSPGGGTPA